MKKLLTFLFCIGSLNSYSQILHIEQIAINFLADSIFKSEKNIKRVRYDGRIVIDYLDTESAISTMWGFPFCKQAEVRDRKEAGIPVKDFNWNREGVELEKQLKAMTLDSASNYEEVRLEVPKGIKSVSGNRNRNFKSHNKNRFNRWKNSVLGSTHELDIYRALEFEKIFLVQIQLRKVYGSTGIIYYIILDKNGGVTDYCRTTYLS